MGDAQAHAEGGAATPTPLLPTPFRMACGLRGTLYRPGPQAEGGCRAGSMKLRGPGCTIRSHRLRRLGGTPWPGGVAQSHGGRGGGAGRPATPSEDLGGDADAPGDAETVGEHPETGAPRRCGKRLDDDRIDGQSVPIALDLIEGSGGE